MRHVPLVLSLLLTACAGGAEGASVSPAYGGPPVRAHRAAGGGLEFGMTVPTASHELLVKSVIVRGKVAEVQLEHVTPGAAMVAQVVSEVHARVEAGELGAATQLEVWVATRPRDGSGGAAAPALALQAPRP